MNSLKIIEKLELCPIISAVHESQFSDALLSPSEIVFLLEGDVMSVAEKIDTAHKSGKAIFVHIDLMKGIGKDKCGGEDDNPGETAIEGEGQPRLSARTKRKIATVGKTQKGHYRRENEKKFL